MQTRALKKISKWKGQTKLLIRQEQAYFQKRETP